MMKKTIIKIGKMLIKMGAKLLYNYIDADKNGQLSKKEITKFLKQMEKIIK